jgi:hypothetical protein
LVVIGYGLFELDTIALSIVNELDAGMPECQEARKPGSFVASKHPSLPAICLKVIDR